MILGINSFANFFLAFHNWIMLYFYEKAGKIDYEGFIPGRGKKNNEVSPFKLSPLI